MFYRSTWSLQGVAPNDQTLHISPLTSLLQTAIDKAKTLPNHRQDEVGEMILAVMQQDSSQLGLSDAQQEEIRNRLARPLDLVPEAEIDAFFRNLAG
jgi:hypothetical protein